MIAKLGGLNAVVLFAVLALAFGLIQLFSGAVEAGITTDEQIHVERTQAWLDTGWYVPEGLLVDGRPDASQKFASPFVYGPATGAIAHIANVAAGNEPLDGVTHSAAAYAVRHLTVAALAVIAIAAVGAAVSLLTGSRPFGLWAAAGLLAVPRWTGQAFFNIKDVPVAAGYTMVTVALIFALCEDLGRPAGLRRRVAIASLLAAGIFVSVGTRLSLWVPLLVSLLAYTALRIGQRVRGGIVRDGGVDFAVFAGVVVGLGAVGAIYPDATATPAKLLLDSVSNSAYYPYEGFTLTAGQLLPEHPPWWYLPVWVGGTYPLVLGALAIVGAIAGLAHVAARKDRAETTRWDRRELGLLLVLPQLTLLPTATAVMSLVTYSGLRQHLYVLPAAAILAGVGAKWLWDWAGPRDNPRAWRAGAAAVLVVALGMPMVGQTLLFPYNYAYVNPLGGIDGVNDRWETDYWFASAPEAIARVPRDVELRCSSFLVPGWEPHREPELTRCSGDQYEPFLSRRGTAIDARSARPAAWVIARRRGGDQPPPYCEDEDDVTRWLWGEEVTMAYVLRCDPRRVRATEHASH